MRTAEILASRILFWGGILSVVLMSLGVLGSWRVGGDVALGRPGTAEVPAVYTSIPQVAAALTRRPVEPLAIRRGVAFLAPFSRTRYAADGPGR